MAVPLVTITDNADNNRAEKQSTSGTIKFVWDEQNYLLETDAARITTLTDTNEPLINTKLARRHALVADSISHR